MTENGQGSMITPELVSELRSRARRPTTVRKLARVIQEHLPGRDPALPVIAGLVYAFRLPLIKVLPVREWIGTDGDTEIDALILPEIEKSRAAWDSEPPCDSSFGQRVTRE